MRIAPDTGILASDPVSSPKEGEADSARSQGVPAIPEPETRLKASPDRGSQPRVVGEAQQQEGTAPETVTWKIRDLSVTADPVMGGAHEMSDDTVQQTEELRNNAEDMDPEPGENSTDLKDATYLGRRPHSVEAKPPPPHPTTCVARGAVVQWSESKIENSDNNCAPMHDAMGDTHTPKPRREPWPRHVTALGTLTEL
ncbi:hypothetical protein BWQ96_08325 [Gracilariopsis chorda]|uniref:Uncharacterized protein n=1 Tax=Gracilariopsis chorda TaxID=448386 RepID=A0A2V3IIL5_9FLOR|nr:hypothetical protein BWQ96_08325 [Gracilariopsis chorda]|eukprot:PXF41945.1 hypothetical protein BWQ96_08325 [Gracilariopsis chorda]